MSHPKEIWQYPALGTVHIFHYYGSGIVVSVPDPTLPIVNGIDTDYSILKPVFRIRNFCNCTVRIRIRIWILPISSLLWVTRCT
jgi:hypothetical protein